MTLTKEEFHKEGEKLIMAHKINTENYDKGNMTKWQYGRWKTKLKYHWRWLWNQHPEVPDSIKQAFNLLYEGTPEFKIKIKPNLKKESMT